MEYEQFVQKIKTKVSNEEYNKLNNEFIEESKIVNVNPESLNQYLTTRWNIYFKKQTFIDSMSNLKQVMVEGIILGKNKTDFGLKKVYDEAIRSFSQDPENAVAQDITNNEGVPLHQYGFNKGKPIQVITYTHQYYGLFKINDNTSFVKGILSSNKELNVQKNCVVTFEAGLKETQSSNDFVCLSAKRTTIFNVKQELSFNELNALFESVGVLSVNQACVLAKKNSESGARNYNDFFIIKGAMGSDGVNVLSEEKNSDVLTLLDQEASFDEASNPLTIWLDKNNTDLPRNISFNAMDIFVVGNPVLGFRNDEESYSLNALGLFVNNKYLVVMDAETINPDTEIIPKEDDIEESIPEEAFI
jgi:hypothetical protein